MSGLFGGGSGGGKNVSITSPIIASIRLQTSAFGRPIALVYGRTRISGNLIWYADFTAVPHTTVSGGGGGGGGKGGGGGGGGGKTTQTTFTYTAACIMGLCEGEIAGIDRVWADKKLKTTDELILSVAVGHVGQDPFSYVTTNHPDEALGYRRLAYVASGYYDLGDSATMPNHSFEIKALLPFGGPNAVIDASPSDVLSSLLTNIYFGAGFPAASLGSLTDFSNYVGAEGLFISPAYVDQTQCTDLLTRLAQIGNSALVYSEGVLKVIPYGDAALSSNGKVFSPNITPVYDLTDDDFLAEDGADPVVVIRGKPSDAFNQVQVRFFNRANQYADEIAEAKDQANIEIYGLRSMEPLDLHEINDAEVALKVAYLVLQRALYLRNKYRFSLGWKYARLEPMDLVTLTESSGDGLQGQTVRIISVEEDEYGTFLVEAEDFTGVASSVVTYPSQQAGGYAVNYAVAPGHVNTPLIFDAPGRCTAAGFELWCAIAGADANWGGAFIWASTDNTTYDLAGVVRGRSRYGVLSGGLTSGVDPDTVSNCLVNLTAGKGELVSGTQADADVFNTLMYVDGELLSYQVATLTSLYNYTLGTYLRRGVYGTPISSHSSGASVARIDAALFRFPYDPSLVGRTVYLKFCSFNVYGGGTENLADVVAYPYTIDGPLGRPQNVASLTASVEMDGTLLTWPVTDDPSLVEYEVRTSLTGEAWDDCDYVGRVRTTQLKVPPSVAGTTTWRVKAVDASGTMSETDATDSLLVTAPSAPVVTAQVVDNNVLLYWMEPVTIQPIVTYEIRRGDVFASATVVGTKSGLFTSVFETVAGTFKYWVVAIDNAGNYGDPGSFVATVSQPPDYVLRTDVDSSLNGTVSNAVFSQGVIHLPINTTETFADHFTTRGWNSPQDQINANYPIFIEPTANSGYYEETFNYGAVLASGKITVTPNTNIIAGSPVATTLMSWKKLVGDPWIDLSAGVMSAFLTDFQYVKAKISVTSSGGDDLLEIAGLNFRIDSKQLSDSGIVTANLSDANGTVVNFVQTFVSVGSITVSPQGNSLVIPVYDFNGVANPTGFKVYLFNNVGARVTGNVSWAAKGN